MNGIASAIAAAVEEQGAAEQMDGQARDLTREVQQFVGDLNAA